MWPCKNVAHIQVLVTYFFPTTPMKLKLGIQLGGRLLIATHFDQSNYLANQKQGAVNKYGWTVFIRLVQGSSSCAFFQSHCSLSSESTGFGSCTSSKISLLSAHGDAQRQTLDIIRYYVLDGKKMWMMFWASWCHWWVQAGG
jgi:hypothetical protein